MYRVEKNRKWLEKLFRTIVKVRDEIKLEFNEDGVSGEFLDYANVLGITLDLPTEEFDTYEGSDELVIGLDVNRAYRMIKSLDSELVTLEVGENETTIQGNSKFKTRNISPNNIKSADESIPKDLGLSFEAIVDFDEINSILNSHSIVSNSITLVTQENEVTITSKENEEEVESELEELEVINSEGINSASFKINYLEDVSGFGKLLDNEITFRFGDDMPLVFEFGDEIDVFLAPLRE